MLDVGCWMFSQLLFSMLTLSNINVSYDGSRILRGVNLTVPEKSLVCLMGRNGVGKTTTLKSIVGLVKPESGSVKLSGTELVGLAPDARAREGIGFVPQGRDIFPHLTVWENLKISLVVHGTKADQVDRVLELFPILKEFLPRKGGVLSGGQQQQLAIARALLTDPKILILDEPTEGIQPNIIDLIGDTLVKIKKEGKISMLLVEQYLDFCLAVGDSFYIMDRGAVVAEGPIAHLNDDIVKKHLTV
jgi:urea transport system ATP-binding protein